MKDSPLLATMVRAAQAGGRVLGRYFGQHLVIREKSSGADAFTRADVESERAVLKILRAAYPAYAVHAEESGKVSSASAWEFVVDPLDGTNNFIIGIPYVSVGIAALRRGRIEAAVVHAPLLKQTFRAQRGRGAWVGPRRLRVNQQSDLRRSMIAAVFGYGASMRRFSAVHRAFYDRAGFKRVLNLWSPALDFCLLADGFIEAVFFERGERYDFLPGKLIAREAGARITGFDGRPLPDQGDAFFASNGTTLHRRTLAALRS